MIVVDTNVVSELLRSAPQQDVFSWWNSQIPGDLFVTVISEAELRYGAAILPEGFRKRELLVRIEHMLTDFFDGRVLAFDVPAAREYARMLAHRRSVGRSLPMQDGMIAAIAYSNGATVATRNVPDFTDCGVPVINPWESASIR
ncbi:MAG: type II toxin-antitoxin system VapC family toxin [Chloroflexota bacterium]|nr:type II toxin-antitoxin system VapC family toxin [Chloroflexota bacterium]